MRLVTAYDWKNPRACEGEDLSLFYPASTGSPGRPPKGQKRVTRSGSKVTGRAATLCASCPARLECLEYALNHGEYGVWGGTTYEQRRAMLRRTLNRRMCVVCDSRDIQVSGDRDRTGVCLSCGMSWRTRIKR